MLVAEHVLTAVRDTDVLARVDANEFYLLLPETGGLGAHACRRRILAELATREPGWSPGGLGVTVGVATFPPRWRRPVAALARGQATRGSFAEQRGVPPEFARALVAGLGRRIARAARRRTGAGCSRPLESPHYIELPAMDLVGLALSTVSEAWRAGQARIVSSVHAGISVGGALRAEHGRDGDGLRFDAVDVSGLEGCANLDVLCVVAEHSAYVLLGGARATWCARCTPPTRCWSIWSCANYRTQPTSGWPTDGALDLGRGIGLRCAGRAGLQAAPRVASRWPSPTAWQAPWIAPARLRRKP
ncbi:MAG: hypothetical protein WDO74_34000 [Pseudomonadota bacterium]